MKFIILIVAVMFAANVYSQDTLVYHVDSVSVGDSMYKEGCKILLAQNSIGQLLKIKIVYDNPKKKAQLFEVQEKFKSTYNSNCMNYFAYNGEMLCFVGYCYAGRTSEYPYRSFNLCIGLNGNYKYYNRMLVFHDLKEYKYRWKW